MDASALKTQFETVSASPLIVRDSATGLEWGPTFAGRMTFAEAEKACAELQIDGKGGFRLPTLAELESIRDLTTFKPAVCSAFKADTKNDFYWSSTPDAESPAVYAWGVYFGYGYSLIYLRYYGHWVRPVRASQ